MDIYRIYKWRVFIFNIKIAWFAVHPGEALHHHRWNQSLGLGHRSWSGSIWTLSEDLPGTHVIPGSSANVVNHGKRRKKNLTSPNFFSFGGENGQNIKKLGLWLGFAFETMFWNHAQRLPRGSSLLAVTLTVVKRLWRNWKKHLGSSLVPPWPAPGPPPGPPAESSAGLRLGSKPPLKLLTWRIKLRRPGTWGWTMNWLMVSPKESSR